MGGEALAVLSFPQPLGVRDLGVGTQLALQRDDVPEAAPRPLERAESGCHM